MEEKVKAKFYLLTGDGAVHEYEKKSDAVKALKDVEGEVRVIRGKMLQPKTKQVVTL